MTNPEIQAVLAGESDGCVVCAFSLGRLVAAPAAVRLAPSDAADKLEN